MVKFRVLCFLSIIYSIYAQEISNFLSDNAMHLKDNMVWPNATIPFYINPQHFDHEQSLAIMTALSVFAFKTCLKFLPVLVKPVSQHVLMFENPNGVRKCTINTEGHAIDEPHTLHIGYDCLTSPQIDMMVMRALGFPFEHNRAIRDLYIDVQHENIEIGALELFTKEPRQLAEMRTLPYDVDSVMHFGERDFSKNGHRTIIFKDHKTKQNRDGLSTLDLRKIELTYGAECRTRDRQEKVELCQNYPGVARRKRDVVDSTKSLRVNPLITPPPSGRNLSENVTGIITELGINNIIEEIIEAVHRVSSLALQNARAKFCNDSKSALRSNNEPSIPKSDILGIVELVAEYSKSMVDHALSNLTAFCEEALDISRYERSRCPFYQPGVECWHNYKSTKSGRVHYSTQHRPLIRQSTKNYGNPYIPKQYARAFDGNETLAEVKNETETVRSKREVDINVETTATTILDKATTIVVKVINETKDEVEGAKLNVESSNKEVKRRQYENNDDEEIRRPSEVLKKELVVRPKNKIKQSHKYPKTAERNEDVTEKKKKKVRTENREVQVKQPKNRYLPRQNKISYKKTEEKQNENMYEKPIKTTLPKTVTLSKMNREFYDERKWSDGIVRYIISDEKAYDLEDLRRRLDEVISIINTKTCVRIQEITEDDAERFEDYLVIDTSPDYVTGKVGGRQVFGSGELFQGGQHRQHAAMMVMAMLGFYFEVSRHDRDKYIRIHMRHVRPAISHANELKYIGNGLSHLYNDIDKQHHFEKIRSAATLPLPYDYKSATHPAWQFWRKVGKTGISTVATYKENDPDGALMKSLGQNHDLLSEWDIVKINSVYGVNCFLKKQAERVDE